ncbi:hypothetical protein D3C73_650230 [compost metagenome]
MAKENLVTSMEDKLWAAADKLRGSIASSKYKDVVLGIILNIFRTVSISVITSSLLKETDLKMIAMNMNASMYFTCQKKLVGNTLLSMRPSRILVR